MNYFDYLETKYVERQEALKVKASELRVGNQGKFNAVMSNIQLGRKVVQWAYQVYLLVAFALIALRVVKAPTHKSSIPAQPEVKPDLKVVDGPSQST